MRKLPWYFYRSKRNTLKKGELIRLMPMTSWSCLVKVTRDCRINDPSFKVVKGSFSCGSNEGFVMEYIETWKPFETQNFIVVDNPMIMRYRIKFIKREISRLNKQLIKLIYGNQE